MPAGGGLPCLLPAPGATVPDTLLARFSLHALEVRGLPHENLRMRVWACVQA